MSNLVKYHFMESDKLTVGAEPRAMYEYIVAKNGVFLYSSNDVFSATIPISPIRDPKKQIRGLQEVWPDIRLPNRTRVPVGILERMVSLSRKALPNEILFHIKYLPAFRDWSLFTPPQKTGQKFVLPLEDNLYIPIEVHSHNTMPAFFSPTDNQDETGLRIYGVLGRVDQPVVDFRLRVSIYGHYSVLPYQLVFEPTEEVKNG